jgi:hypothetical protein
MRLRLFTGAFLTSLAAGSVAAADLIEPWDSGFSNFELFVAVTAKPRSRAVASLAGFGVGGGVSLGTWVSQTDAEESQNGFVGILTRPLSPRMEVDVWGEVVVVNTLDEDARRREAQWGGGTEWSLALPRVVPYARASHASTAEGRQLRGLTGLMLPVGSLLELHLEAAAEQPGAGPWLTSLALGPNLLLHPRVELLPEIAYVIDRAAGEATWVATIGIVIDPRRRRTGSGS